MSGIMNFKKFVTPKSMSMSKINVKVFPQAAQSQNERSDVAGF
jgi:hypothetical protein